MGSSTLYFALGFNRVSGIYKLVCLQQTTMAIPAGWENTSRVLTCTGVDSKRKLISAVKEALWNKVEVCIATKKRKLKHKNQEMVYDWRMYLAHIWLTGFLAPPTGKKGLLLQKI